MGVGRAGPFQAEFSTPTRTCASPLGTLLWNYSMLCFMSPKLLAAGSCARLSQGILRFQTGQGLGRIQFTYAEHLRNLGAKKRYFWMGWLRFLGSSKGSGTSSALSRHREQTFHRYLVHPAHQLCTDFIPTSPENWVPTATNYR